MGLIGLTAMFVSYFFIKQSFENQSEGTGNKFIEGLIPFTYAPYFLIIKNLYANDNSKIKRFFPKILAFTIIVFAVGIGGNARSLFITGIVAAGIGYFLGLLLGKFEFKILTGKNIMIASIAFWLLTGPIADIGTAMLVVRQQRGTISKEAMLRKTIDVYEDKEALRVYKKIADENRLIREWDEHYFDNIFLARFCNLKFNDASLEQYNKIGRVDPQLQQFSIDRSLAVLPQPMLSLLQIDIDKIKLISSSFGDNLFSRAGGSYALGGFRLGQFAGTGMASFGWWYLLILAVGIIPVYFALDLFVIHSKGIRRTLSSPLLSLSGLIPITTIFMFLSLSSISESVVNLYTYLLRGWPQLVILYWLMFFITRRIGWLISSK
jgi:hypothetical protein